MPNNDGAWVDERGETDDWVELINTGENTVSLAGYRLGDDLDRLHPLPDIPLDPGGVVILWADRELDQGQLHLPFKLSSGGETLHLQAPDSCFADVVTFPKTLANETLARLPDGTGELTSCGWATPNRANGEGCGPPPAIELPGEIKFAPYVWPDPWPTPPAPLVLTELALRPAGFVEILNTSEAALDLAEYQLTLSPHPPGQPWPGPTDGTQLALPSGKIPAGERIVVPVTATELQNIATDPDYEGVLTLWRLGQITPVDRVDFMAWPEGAALARDPDSTGRHRFCETATPGQPNTSCDPLSSRPLNERLRHLRTPGDFNALARGGAAVGIASVKFIVDMEAGDAVHLLSSEAYDLHFTFVRELIDGLSPLDRCDPAENQLFHQGWGQFSQTEYFQVEGRRYLLGTLSHHASNDLYAMEFSTGDAIAAAQMVRAFFGVTRCLERPSRWVVRPQSDSQVTRLRSVEGHLPLVDPSAPFRNITVQPLTSGVAYGVLTFVPAGELSQRSLGPQVVLITDQVPNDLPLTGGLITEEFQTPLSHVNVLSRNRGTPNMALISARTDPRITPHLDQLVRFEVNQSGFELRRADPAEAEAFWAATLGQGDPLVPRLDLTVRGVQDLEPLGLEALPAIGAKAAQLAELQRVWSTQTRCPGPVNTPEDAMAIPVVHFLEHMAASGAKALLEQLRADPGFRADPTVRSQGLAQVRAAIWSHPVDPELLTEVRDAMAQRFGEGPVRFRSSSNTEDLPGFNGAGLYTSLSGTLKDPEHPMTEAILTVWASLYSARAYEERRYHNVDESSVAMGILMHRAFRSERANGVAISRNILEPIRSDHYYFNAQMGEATVTNPAPGVTTEQIIYRKSRTPRLIYQARSNLPGGAQVLTLAEADHAACVLAAIHAHFQPRLDPLGENRWFAMDIEFKLIGDRRQLMVKQARPYTFGNAVIPQDCREY